MFFKGKLNLCTILGSTPSTNLSTTDPGLFEVGFKDEKFNDYINLQVELLFSSILEQIPNTKLLIKIFKKFNLAQLFLYTIVNDWKVKRYLQLGKSYHEIISHDIYMFFYENKIFSSGIPDLKYILDMIKSKLKDKFGTKEGCIDFEELTLSINKFELKGEQADSFKAATYHFDLQPCHNIQEIINQK